MAKVPRIFQPFCTYWRLTEAQGHQFWNALVRSHYSQPTAWRQHLLLFEATGLGTSMQLIDQVSTPATVIAVLEALIHEGTLRPGEARRMEGCLLRRVDGTGHWKAEGIGKTDTTDR